MVPTFKCRRERTLEAARGYLMLEMPEHALAELDRLDDQQPKFPEIDRLRAEALQQLGRCREAVAFYLRAVAERADDLAALRGLATCYKQTGRLRRAIATLEEAYRMRPQEPSLLFHLACYLALAGKKVQALSWLGRALRMKASLRKRLADERDLDGLRHDPDFECLMNLTARADPT